MASAAYPQTGYRSGASPRERGTALALALALTVALILLLVRLGALPLPGTKMAGALTTFTFPGRSPTPKRAVEKPRTRKSAAQAAPKARPLVQATTSPVPVPNWTQTSHDELAALDTALATAHGARSARADGAGRGDDDGDSGGGGGGGAAGDRLFAADWYKRPSDAELDPYLGQARARSGWGEIACRTAPRFRVEDCRELEESPGSGIARALREAAWQFQVLPPRINGRPQVGAWVRIHFDLIEGFRGR